MKKTKDKYQAIFSKDIIVVFCIFFVLNIFPTAAKPIDSTKKEADDSVQCWIDGTFQGEFKDWPLMTVQVTIVNQRIDSIRIVNDSSSPEHTQMMQQTLPVRIVESQTTDLDAVTGATLSSNSFMSAVRDALSKAVP